MSFDKLVAKVKQAEDALEAQERQMSADFRQFKASWRATWTPGRIVIAGLASGFLVGRAEPFKHVAGGGVLQLISALSGLFASGQAQDAATNADQAAQAAEVTAAVAVGDASGKGAPIGEPGLTSFADESRRDGPRRREPHPSGPTPAEAATELSER